MIQRLNKLLYKGSKGYQARKQAIFALKQKEEKKKQERLLRMKKKEQKQITDQMFGWDDEKKKKKTNNKKNLAKLPSKLEEEIIIDTDESSWQLQKNFFDDLVLKFNSIHIQKRHELQQKHLQENLNLSEVVPYKADLLQELFSDKRVTYNFLNNYCKQIYIPLNNKGQFYLPPFNLFTNKFAGELITGVKKIFQQNQIEKIKITKLLDVSRSHLVQIVENDFKLLIYMPKLNEERMKLLPREYIANVYYTYFNQNVQIINTVYKGKLDLLIKRISYEKENEIKRQQFLFDQTDSEKEEISFKPKKQLKRQKKIQKQKKLVNKMIKKKNSEESIIIDLVQNSEKEQQQQQKNLKKETFEIPLAAKNFEEDKYSQSENNINSSFENLNQNISSKKQNSEESIRKNAICETSESKNNKALEINLSQEKICSQQQQGINSSNITHQMQNLKTEQNLISEPSQQNLNTAQFNKNDLIFMLASLNIIKDDVDQFQNDTQQLVNQQLNNFEMTEQFQSKTQELNTVIQRGVQQLQSFIQKLAKKNMINLDKV